MSQELPGRTLIIGREDVFSWIKRHITPNSSAMPLILHGPTGIGKTTVIGQLANAKLTKTALVIAIDMETLIDLSMRDFLWTLSKRMYSGLKALVPSMPELEKRMVVLHPEQAFWNYFWSPLLRATRGKHLLIAWDNVDKFTYRAEETHPDEHFLDYIYRMRQSASNITYLFAIGTRPSAISDDRFSPFELSLSYRLRRFQLDETRRLISKAISSTVYSPVADFIHTLTGGHPGDIASISRILEKRAKRLGTTQVTLADIAFVLDNILSPIDFRTSVYEMRENLFGFEINSVE